MGRDEKYEQFTITIARIELLNCWLLISFILIIGCQNSAGSCSSKEKLDTNAFRHLFYLFYFNRRDLSYKSNQACSALLDFSGQTRTEDSIQYYEPLCDFCNAQIE